MSIFKKLSEIIRINVNEKVKEGDQPEKKVELMILEMQEAMVKATSSLSEVISNKRRMEKKYWDMVDRMDEFEVKAKKSLRKGDEEGARSELMEKARLKKSAEEYKMLFEKAKDTASKLEHQVHQLKAKLEATRSEKAELTSRSEQAKARKTFAEKEAGMSVNNFTDFEKLREQIIEQELLADVSEQMSNDDYDIDKALGSDTDLEEEIRALRRSLESGES